MSPDDPRSPDYLKQFRPQDPLAGMRHAMDPRRDLLPKVDPIAEFHAERAAEVVQYARLLPPKSKEEETIEANFASEFRKRLVRMINAYDASLDADHEVGLRLVSFGQTIVFHLEQVGYYNPSLITFSGRTDDKKPVELIQHVSQISVLLMTLPRLEPEKPKKKIGFVAPVAEEQEG